MTTTRTLRGALVALAAATALSGCSLLPGHGTAQPPPAPSSVSTPPTPTFSDDTSEPSDGFTDSTPSPTVDARTVLQRNRLYRLPRIAGAGCAGSSQVPLDSLGHMQAYYRSVLVCLNRVWGRALRAGGLPFRPASLTVFSAQNASPCGRLAYSYYCPQDQTINMYADEMINPWRQYPNSFSHGITRLAAAHTIAHEFGHHVQELTGIFEAADPQPGSATERRSELQASCLGNVFLSSQRGAYPIASVYWSARWQPNWRFITRVPNHGTQANQQYWTDQGYRTARPGACNTWSAPASRAG